MRTYADQVTAGAQNVVTTYATVRPSIGADDPANALYTTFAAAYAAVTAATGPKKTIYIDSPGVIVNIAAAAYDLKDIAIIGLATSVLSNAITIADGTTFTNWPDGFENCSVIFLGTAPLFDQSAATATARVIRTGKRCVLACAGTAPMIRCSNAGAILGVEVEDFSTIGLAAYEVVDVAAGEIQLNLYDNTTLGQDTVRGVGGTTLGLLFVGVGPQFLTQANFAGTLATFDGAANLYYETTDLLAWATLPTTTGDALDRIATAVAGLLGVPIP